jgi:hypothetical protein
VERSTRPTRPPRKIRSCVPSERPARRVAVSWIWPGGLERRGSDRRSAGAKHECPRRRQLTASQSHIHLNASDGQDGARSASPEGRPVPVSRERPPASTPGAVPHLPWETDGRKIFPIKAS